MEDLKPWWTSKAIWTGVIGSLWGIAGKLGVLPAGLDQADALTVVLALTGTATHVLPGRPCSNMTPMAVPRARSRRFTCR